MYTGVGPDFALHKLILVKDFLLTKIGHHILYSVLQLAFGINTP